MRANSQKFLPRKCRATDPRADPAKDPAPVLIGDDKSVHAWLELGKGF
jgi:hypothetical protein